MDRGAWWATVHGVTKSWIQLSTHGVAKRFRHHGSLRHSFLAFFFIKKWVSTNEFTLYILPKHPGGFYSPVHLEVVGKNISGGCTSKEVGKPMLPSLTKISKMCQTGQIPIGKIICESPVSLMGKSGILSEWDVNEFR